MTTLARRIDELESGGPDPCPCQGPPTGYIWAEYGAPVVPEICPRCGREKPVVQLRWDTEEEAQDGDTITKS
jgi:hypothetical protein